MKRFLGLKARTETATEEGGHRNSWGSIRLIFPYIRRHALRLSTGFAALLLVDLFQLLIPRVIKQAVDALQQGTATPSQLVRYAEYIVLLAVLIASLRYVWRVLLLGFSRILETSLRNRMFSHILTLDKAYFQRHTTGEIMALTTNDLSSVQLASGMGFVASVDATFMGLAAIGFMAYIHPLLTLIAVLPMPILAFLTRTLSGRLHVRFKKVQEQFSLLTEFVRSTFSSIRLIKAYNQEFHQAERFNQMGETYVRDNLRLATIHGTLFPISGFIGNVSMLLVLFFGGRLTIEGSMTAGDFVAFISYLYLMTWPMMAIGWVADLFQRGVTSLGRIHALLLERPSLVNIIDSAPSIITKGSIQVRNLSFSYTNQVQQNLRGIHLDVKPGLFLGIVGRTGAGKTTLCHLLTRLL